MRQFRKSQNAPVPYPAMLHSEQKCSYFYSEWSTVGYGTSAFWDLSIRFIVIHHWITPDAALKSSITPQALDVKQFYQYSAHFVLRMQSNLHDRWRKQPIFKYIWSRCIGVVVPWDVGSRYISKDNIERRPIDPVTTQHSIDRYRISSIEGGQREPGDDEELCRGITTYALAISNERDDCARFTIRCFPITRQIKAFVEYSDGINTPYFNEIWMRGCVSNWICQLYPMPVSLHRFECNPWQLLVTYPQTHIRHPRISICLEDQALWGSWEQFTRPILILKGRAVSTANAIHEAFIEWRYSQRFDWFILRLIIWNNMFHTESPFANDGGINLRHHMKNNQHASGCCCHILKINMRSKPQQMQNIRRWCDLKAKNNYMDHNTIPNNWPYFLKKEAWNENKNGNMWITVPTLIVKAPL